MRQWKARYFWRSPCKGRTAVIPAPIYSDGCVHGNSAYGIGYNLVKITEAGGKLTTEEAYANKELSNKHGGVI